MNQTRIVIIGAGPTGLGAACRLLEIGEPDFVVLEAAASPGGLASSTVDEAGFTWDLGSHVQHSHYAKFDEYMDLALRSHEWIERRRSTWVWLCDRLVPYPFQLNLHRLPKRERWRCVAGLIAAQQNGNGNVEDFEQWISATFGAGIADAFMRPYNEKIWAWPLSQLSHQWISDRVAAPQLEQVLRGICLDEDNTAWGPNATFRYPRRGGTGAIWRRLADRLPPQAVRYDWRAASIDRRSRVVTCQTGERCRYEHLISTMPLDRLAAVCRPNDDLTATKRLKRTSSHIVGVGLQGELPESLQGRLWGYYCQDWLPFYRLTIMSNLSAENAPGATWSIMAEVAKRDQAEQGADIVERVVRGVCDAGLLENDRHVISRWHRRLDHGYPVPTLERDEILAAVLPRLQRDGVYSRGRFGAWKYEVSNQDHSFMQGVEAVDRILLGRPEITLHQPELANSRHNPFPFPEWDAVKL